MEGLILEKSIFDIVSNRLAQSLQILFIELAAYDRGVELVTAALNLAQHLARHIVVIHVGLDLVEHGLVGFPVILESRVLHNDQVDDVQVGKH